MSFLVNMVFRELRAAWRRLLFFFVCVSIGVGAIVVCGQGSAPAGATIAHYRDHLGLDIVPGTGLLPACVPARLSTMLKPVSGESSAP